MTSTKFETKPLFTRQQLTALLLPLIAEQALSVTIGLADTLMVSSVGEAAVSGVSLVDTFNTLMIQIMTKKSRFTVTMTLTELPQPHFYINFYFHSVQMSNTTYPTAKVRGTV